jgi:predicted PurR-regulated permease PerM
MESKLEELVALANQSRGGFWVGMAIVSAISGVVGFIGSYISSK